MFQNAKLALKSRTGARGGYNQVHANRQTIYDILWV